MDLYVWACNAARAAGRRLSCGTHRRHAQRETGTTAGSALRHPQKDREFARQLKKRQFRCGMVTRDTLAEAQISWCAAVAALAVLWIRADALLTAGLVARTVVLDLAH